MTPDGLEGLDGLHAFMRVARTRSFTAAAREAGVSPSAMSYAIRQLEAKLELRLFQRTTRSVSLTEAGAALLVEVEPLMEGMRSVLARASRSAAKPAGTLRLNASRSGAALLIQPAMRPFLDAYPEISLELVIDNGLVDIVSQGFDAGIRFGNVLEKDMHVVPLLPDLRAAVAASPDYLERHGVPEHPSQLLAHDCINFRSDSSRQMFVWPFAKDGEQVQVPVKGRVVTNDPVVVLQAALDGVGLAYLYEPYVAHHLRSGQLLRVLEDWSPSTGLFLYYFSQRDMPPKLRVFIDFFKTLDLAALTAPKKSRSRRVPT